MTKRMFTLMLLGGALALALLPVKSGAGELPTAPDDVLALSNDAPLADLGSQSGGSELSLDDLSLNWAFTSQQVNGQVNAGHDVVTGGIFGNVVQDVRGVNSLMYNTGNNVSFSNTMQFNINLH